MHTQPPSKLLSPIVRIDSLVKRYGSGDTTVHALNNVSLEIRKGDFVCLMGSSGSGKSTLLNILGTIDVPDSGSVVVNGKELMGLQDAELTLFRRDTIGFVFQFFNLMPTMTVLENVMLPHLLSRGNDEEARTRSLHLLEEVGLVHRLYHKPHELSGGEMQRVAIARALVNDPEILLADEPTGNLDSVNSSHVMDILQNLTEKLSKTLLVASHSTELARRADRILVMKDGMLPDA